MSTMELKYALCPAALAKNPPPHTPHMHSDNFRCIGVPERDDRARTFNPRGKGDK